MDNLHCFYTMDSKDYRTKDDLRRNAIVSVFLRTLEYYSVSSIIPFTFYLN